MGLDVYVGSLTRYYAGNWETIVQQLAREGGASVQIVRPNQGRRRWFSRLLDRFRPDGTTASARAVRRWRDRLRRELSIPDLDWNETADAEYLTDKPAWDCYGALVLWAAYEDLPNAKRRPSAEGWDQDPAYLTAYENPNSRYRHLIAETEIWLPVEFSAPRSTVTISGDQVVVGSSNHLLRELRELNARTWNATDLQIANWRHEGAEYGAPLETSARFGFSIFYQLVHRSVAAKLPMKLDY
jgi:hypothetical protein